ncbi:uncharacterized protein VNE69_03187 [Vairimorpha necatrix]|uniref:Uncharacterized protein n=1 Tax=Vairimorpha necatrix TaxID=6039 RepID=A0AAX4JAF3_9MICR
MFLILFNYLHLKASHTQKEKEDKTLFLQDSSENVKDTIFEEFLSNNEDFQFDFKPFVPSETLKKSPVQGCKILKNLELKNEKSTKIPMSQSFYKFYSVKNQYNDKTNVIDLSIKSRIPMYDYNSLKNKSKQKDQNLIKNELEVKATKNNQHDSKTKMSDTSGNQTENSTIECLISKYFEKKDNTQKNKYENPYWLFFFEEDFFKEMLISEHSSYIENLKSSYVTLKGLIKTITERLVLYKTKNELKLYKIKIIDQNLNSIMDFYRKCIRQLYFTIWNMSLFDELQNQQDLIQSLIKLESQKYIFSDYIKKSLMSFDDKIILDSKLGELQIKTKEFNAIFENEFTFIFNISKIFRQKIIEFDSSCNFYSNRIKIFEYIYALSYLESHFNEMKSKFKIVSRPQLPEIDMVFMFSLEYFLDFENRDILEYWIRISKLIFAIKKESNLIFFQYSTSLTAQTMEVIRILMKSRKNKSKIHNLICDGMFIPFIQELIIKLDVPFLDDIETILNDSIQRYICSKTNH